MAATIYWAVASDMQVSKLGRGNYGITMLLRHRQTGDLVAGKFIDRGGMVRSRLGLRLRMWRSVTRWVRPFCDNMPHTTPCIHAPQINVNVDREILNHRLLVHPHIIRFHEVHHSLPMLLRSCQQCLVHRLCLLCMLLPDVPEVSC